nr:PAS domain-containing protein [uncultured Rhodopila sp.]
MSDAANRTLNTLDTSPVITGIVNHRDYSRLYFSPRHFQPGTFNAYLLAAALVAAATALQAAFGSDFPGAQFLSLFPAVIAATLICGTAAGFFSIAMATLCAWLFVLPDVFSFRLEGVRQTSVLLLFAATASAVVFIAGGMRKAIDRARHHTKTFAAMFEAYPDAILLADRRGRIANVNQRMVDLFRVPRAQLIGALVDSLLPPRLRDNHVSQMVSYGDNPRPREVGAGLDLFAVRGDGEEFVVDVNISPIEIDGEVLTIATVRDRTANKALHTALAESRHQQAILEERALHARALHIALESTTDSVIVLDRAWRFTYLNERARARLERGRGLMGQVIWDVFPGLGDSLIGMACRAAMDDGTPTRADDCFAASRAHFDAHAYPSPDGLTVFLRDVTAERELAAAKAESDALLRLFIDRTPASIAMFDTEMRYLAASRRFAADHRIGDGLPESLIGRSHYELFPGLAEQRRDVYRRVLAGETLAAAEEPMPHVNGRTEFVHWEMAPWRRADGSIGGAVLFSEIVTGRVQAELALRQLTEDLKARLRENDDLLARLSSETAAREAAQERAAHAERVEALGQLAGGIAHDFNNVLQMVKGAATLIERRPGDQPGVARLAGLAMEATERGGAITRRLLAFGRRGNLRGETLDVAAVLGSLKEIFVHTLGAGIEVRICLADDLPQLFVDKAQLETVLVNLATNARDAMPDGGRLTLSAAADEAPAERAGLSAGRYVRIEVADTGMGMDAKTLARAYEPFFTTKPAGVGTGLGLPMARGFAEQSGGALTVDSSPGSGTTVTLWLPTRDAETEAVAPDMETEAAASGTGIASASARVLLVDDEEALRELLAQNLEDRGYRVLAAAGGEEALALLAAGEAVDVLVSDLSMPGMNGIALIRAAQALHADLPAVLLTGYVGDEAALAMGAAITGAYSLAHKPIGTNELVDRIEALLAGQASP